MKTTTITLFIILAAVALYFGITNRKSVPTVTSFEQCVALGNPVMESYPRQCAHGGATFIEVLDDPVM